MGQRVLEESKAERQAARPALLYALLAAGPCRVGDLIELAKSLPEEWVVPTAIALSESIKADYATDRRAALRRRQLVILTTLLSRLTFYIEGVPQEPDARV
jgi:hypothetical protein